MRDVGRDAARFRGSFVTNRPTEAVSSCGVDHHGGILFRLHPVIRRQHTRIKVLDTQADAVKTDPA